ncbi:hypothetical protein DFH28DRAFT_834372, partial [Melampsora americana]
LVWDPTAAVLPINLVTRGAYVRMTKTTWNDCTDVLESLYQGLFLDHARLIFRWDSHLLSLLRRTQIYCQATIAEDNVLELKWIDM